MALKAEFQKAVPEFDETFDVVVTIVCVYRATDLRRSGEGGFQRVKCGFEFCVFVLPYVSGQHRIK